MLTGGIADDGAEIRSPRAVFTQRFAELYAAAGNPTLRRVASAAETRMHAARGAGAGAGAASAQRISDWKAGRNVPARFESLLPVVLTLIDLAKKSGGSLPAALLDPREWQRLWQASTTWTSDDDTVCPYPGLMSFRDSDQDFFFGRHHATTDFTDLVRDTVATTGGIITLVGASGAGKSSLLAAGLTPALTRAPHDWVVATVTPGATPLATLAKALRTEQLGEVHPPHTSDAVPRTRTARTESVDDTLAAVNEWAAGRRALLIIDQFEELFTTCPDEHEREDLLTVLERCATSTENIVGVVLALRADFYAQCLAYPALQDALEHRNHLLGPMRIDELAQAITGPAERTGLKLEAGLEELVITELCGLGDHENKQSYDPGALPLLSHVMAATWQHREGHKLTVTGYRKAGGVVGSVAATAEQAWSELTDPQQLTAKELLLGLVTVGHDSRDTRRTTTRTELLQRVADTESATTALELLARTRLVTLDADEAYFSHEIVLDAWPRLRTWIDEDRVGYLVRQRLEADAAEWNSTGRDPSLLYRGTRLETARVHVDPPPVGGPARTFLDASLAARQQSTRRSSVTKALLALLAVALLLLGGAAYTQTRIAAQQRTDKDFAAVLEQADRLQTIDPSLAARMYLAADAIQPRAAKTRTRLLSTQNTPLATTVTEHPNVIWQVAYRPDGRVLASVGHEGSVRLSDVADPENPKPLGRPLDGSARRITFSPDGSLMAVAGQQDSRLWDVRTPETPRPLGTLTTAAIPVLQAAFSPDGRTVATQTRDTVVLWNVENPAAPRQGPVLPIPESGSLRGTLAFSPNGRLLAVPLDGRAGDPADNGSVQLWDVGNLAAVAPIGPALGAVNSSVEATAFSPNGLILAVGSGDGSLRSREPDSEKNSGTVQLWGLEDPARPRRIGTPVPAGESSLSAVAFAPDGQTLVTSTLGETKLWSVLDPARPTQIGEHFSVEPTTCRYPDSTFPCSGGAHSLAFGPDGRMLATGNSDGRVRLWSLPSAHTGVYSTLPPLSDAGGDRMVTKAGKGRIQIWDTHDPWIPRRVGDVDAAPEYSPLHLSPDGRTLVLSSLSADGAAQETMLVFDLSDPANTRRVAQWTIPRNAYRSAEFSPDGRRMVTRVDKGALEVWDISDRSGPVKLGASPPVSGYQTMRLNPDGTILAVSSAVLSRSASPTALWNLSDPAKPTQLGPPLPETPAGINYIRFSPDRRTMILQSNETFQVWDIGDPARPKAVTEPITVHSQSIQPPEFSPDGTTLAITGADGAVWLWDFTDRTKPRRIGDAITLQATGQWSARFHPRGDYLLGQGPYGELRVWDLNEQHATARICATTRGVLTPEVWRRYLPDVPYRATCD
ncbi:AAA family ATPase [Nocardia sp. NPDC052566]|uniref:nSTAND1 domain-containing NTPase n=1 Tax=Nocardia sp. NPDC052566 TaxID=3364330 RepID=UPI0037CB2737